MAIIDLPIALIKSHAHFFCIQRCIDLASMQHQNGSKKFQAVICSYEIIHRSKVKIS